MTGLASGKDNFACGACLIPLDEASFYGMLPSYLNVNKQVAWAAQTIPERRK
jgi:hypothetical protein